MLMIKKVVSLLRKVVVAFLVLYAFNILVNSLNIVIPINYFTIGTVTVLGIPGLLSLIALFFIIK